CMFDQISEKNPMFVPNHLLAESVDELTVSRMIVADCDLSLWGSVGLLFDTVYANASFSQVAMLGCDIQSSLFAAESAEDATLFGILVHGTADYSDILFFDCHVRGSIASSFGHMGKVGMMKNICFDRCSFTTDYELPLCFSDTLSGALFFSEKRTEFYAPVDPETVAAFAMTEAELLTDAEIENVCVTNSVVMLPDGRELADYRAYGIIVENCLNIVD
ncbi:MAG: hypothetical protein IIW14_05710, partial [Kiritimatiellae bacterium]|nr:hypothetical protein [Kiritimatiellia bacterium]